MLAPNTLGLLVFVFVPTAIALYTSMCKYDALSPMEWIGLENYKTLLHHEEFWEALWRTVKYTLIVVPGHLIFSILVGVLVNAIPKTLQSISRTLIFFPFCISSVISGLMWKFLLNHQNGYINHIISFFGGEKQPFFGSQTQALPAVAISALWVGVGYSMVIMLAAIKDIPRDYYEAADIDGANAFHKFFYITLPQLTFSITFILITSTISSFQVFDQVNVITKGGPGRATQVVVHLIYDEAFKQYQVGYASACSVLVFILLLALSSVQLRLMTKKD